MVRIFNVRLPAAFNDSLEEVSCSGELWHLWAAQKHKKRVYEAAADKTSSCKASGGSHKDPEPRL